MTSPEPIDDELLRMAGSPKAAQAIKEGLQKLSKGSAGPDLAEMAKELLAGRTSLREVGSSSAYAPRLTEAFGEFQKWRSELSPDQRRELEQRAREEFGEPDD